MPMSEQDGTKAIALQRPANDDTEAWKEYWKTQGQEWRTEPEIDTERQKYLDERRSITPDIEQGIYPFKDIRLSRADVEWLLATHENGRGPVDWSNENQRERTGLDLRGADLCQADLRNLPLACIQGGLGGHVQSYAIEGLDDNAIVHMEKAILREAHLECANLRKAHMQGADLFRAHLEATYLNEANLAGTDLRSIFFDTASTLRDVVLCDNEHGFISVADARWAGVNLALLKWPRRKWSKLLILGDESKARQVDSRDRAKRIEEYEGAVRANRQLTGVLRDQGLNELADHFAYRAQMLQRKVFRYQGKVGPYLFSLLLAMLSGYGYRIWRILAAYIVMVSLFALAYFVLGMHYSPHLPLDQAYLESITAFHGRVFFEQFSPNTPQIWFTALEALAGLIIEGVFIAMLIQRFF